MDKKVMFKVSAVLTLAVAALAGCSGQNASNKSPQPTVSAAVNENIDPNAKYDPPIEVSTHFSVGASFADKFKDEQLNTNVFAKGQLEELGIKLTYKWIARGDDQSFQKSSVAIASGDIPEIMVVTKEQLATLSKTDMIHKDLAPIYEKYASKLTKDIMHEEGDIAFDSATFNGKLIAIPNTDSSGDLASFLWIRLDWLEKLNLETPKSMDDLYNVIRAFVERDPDGNNKKDTVGLMLNKDFLSPGVGDAVGIFNGFHAYPKSWVKDDSGNLVYGSVQPEMKEALAYLQKLYKDGFIEQDFGAKDSGKAAELAGANRVGVEFGAMWNGMYPLQATKENFPNSDWRAMALLSNDDKPARPQVKLNVANYYVVKKEFQHPEALIKLLNFWTEKNWGSSKEDYDKYIGNLDTGAAHLNQIRAWPSKKNMNAHLHVKEAFATGDTSKLNSEEKSYYDNIVKFKAGDNKVAQFEKVFGETGSFAIMDQYYTKNLFMMDQYYGASTETMKNKMSTIVKSEMEYYTKVIMGSESLDKFDTFVAKLNKLGLEQITKEVNEWNKNR
ncbi:hypothetical protein [Paenibacillus herberti]|uniref:ABC transporter substrate-binding protein n=1 Tax=Paenibacillus herberti TaxID=1619309 RepID=A0A229P2T8_9BACL|nr:hypothetical protein [Paenibacillus herberti]OXM16264.1 hypothetical protein CGZ75_06120 [Paenibacillus herberti]